MKLVHFLPLSVFLVAGPGTSRANAYVYSSGPLPRSSSLLRNRNKNCANGDIPNFASSPRKDRYRQRDQYRERQDYVNQVLRELQEELGDNQRDSWATMRSPQYPFKNADKESTKKWVEKAIDLASEFNKDFAATSKERDATDEVLQKSRDWVSRMYKDQENEAATDDVVEDQGSSLKEPNSPISSNKTPNDSENRVTPPPLSEKPQDFLSETPNSENRSNEEMFQVAVDLPGVERTNVDVTLDSDFLVIEATRNSGSDGQPRRKYVKKIAFVENEVDMDKMEATLHNGVLLVSAPKNKVTEIKRKILIT